MTWRFKYGKPLFIDGKPAFGDDCCECENDFCCGGYTIFYGFIPAGSGPQPPEDNIPILDEIDGAGISAGITAYLRYYGYYEGDEADNWIYIYEYCLTSTDDSSTLVDKANSIGGEIETTIVAEAEAVGFEEGVSFIGSAREQHVNCPTTTEDQNTAIQDEIDAYESGVIAPEQTRIDVRDNESLNCPCVSE